MTNDSNSFLQPKLIIWDWDNTLINSKPTVVAALQDLVEEYHLSPLTNQDVIDIMGTYKGRYWQENFGSQKEQAIEKYLLKYKKYADLVQLFPETKEVLTLIQKMKIPQMVISNKNQEILDKECDALGIRSYLTAIVGTDEKHSSKPSLQFAYEIFGNELPQNVLLIGDGESDMIFAKNLGAFGLFIRSEEQQVPFSYDARVPDLGGVLSFLKQHILCSSNK